MNDLKKTDGMITLHATQSVDGETERIEVLTTGYYAIRRGSFFISYDESEATGFEGSRTTLRYDPAHGQVTMTRIGATQSELIIEKGRRHQCTYDTGYGNLILGVSGDSIESTLDETGGELLFRYSLDINTALASENSVQIQVALTPQ